MKRGRFRQPTGEVVFDTIDGRFTFSGYSLADALRMIGVLGSADKFPATTGQEDRDDGR